MEEDKREQELYERDLSHADSGEDAGAPEAKPVPASPVRTGRPGEGTFRDGRRKRPKNSGSGALAFFKAAAAVEAVIIALGAGLLGGFCIANQVSVTELLSQAARSAREAKETSGSGAEILGRYTEGLAGKLASYSEDAFLPFAASIVEIDGMETLCLSKDDLKIYYRNEYGYDEVDGSKRIRLENETRMIEYEWDYDLTGDLTLLVPDIGAFNASDTGQTQLVFMRYHSSEIIPEEVRFVDLDRLADYSPVYLAEELKDLFVAEQQVTAELESVMKLTVGDVVYRYYMPENLVMAGFNMEDQFRLTLEEGRVALESTVGVPGGGYLGELSAAIVHTAGGFELADASFSSYAQPDIEDPGKEAIIVPQEEVPEETISISGRNGGRYLIELSSAVPRMSYDLRNLTEENGYKVYRENGVRTSVTGIDVSKYQGDIDWDQVKSAGVEYAIIRLGYRGYGEGTLEVDPYYEQNIQGANEAGIPAGVYFFSQAVTVEEAREEADMVIEQIRDYQIDYPVVFDTESIPGTNARANELPRELRTDIAIAFCERIREAGYTPMVYCNTRWMIMNINLERLTDYEIWYAYFGDNLTFPYHFDMWQYTNEGSVPGIDGAVDLNISFKNYAE